MKPSELAETVAYLLDVNLVPFVKGEPGIGKSAIARGVAAQMNARLIDVRAAQFDPVDLRGLPIVTEDQFVKWAAPGFLPKPDDGPTVIFLDEINAAPPLVQAACYQLVLDRALGEYTLPDNCRIVAAGNNEGDRAVVSRLSTAMKSRLITIKLEVDLRDWCSWADTVHLRPEVIAYLQFQQMAGKNHLHVFNKDADSFACPRTWEFVSRILSGNPPKNPAIELAMYSGCVGTEMAREFVAFLRVFRDLSSPAAVFMDPDGAKIPTQPDAMMALCGALANMASDANFDQLVRFCDRIKPEYALLIVTSAVKRCPAVQQTPGFIGWTTRNQDLLS